MKYYMYFFSFAAFMLLACSQGLLDSSEKIGSTGYFYTYVDSENRYIWKRAYGGGQMYVVDKKVVQYEYNDTYIVAARQVSNSYACAEQTIATELKDEFEYWVVDVKTERVSGPLSYGAYREAVDTLNIPRDLDLKDASSLREKNAPHSIAGCTNPVKID